MPADPGGPELGDAQPVQSRRALTIAPNTIKPAPIPTLPTPPPRVRVDRTPNTAATPVRRTKSRISDLALGYG